MNQDPYRVLGISPSATDDEVKQAYRAMAKKYHPDRNGGSAEAEARMMEVNDAYTQIMNMRKNGGSSYQSGYGQGGYGSYSGQSGYGSQNGYNSYGSQSNGNPFNGFDPFGFGGFSSFGGSGQTYSGQQTRTESPIYTQVREKIQLGRYNEALRDLDNISDRSAAWYYYSAQANQGLGNEISALNYARQAVQMDPGNYEYRSFLNKINRNDSQDYRQGQQGFGGIPQYLCSNPCISCIALNLLFNCCCGCGRGFYC